MKKELLVLKILTNGFRTKNLTTKETLSLKTDIPYEVSELDTIIFQIDKEWTFKKQKYATGKVIENKFILENIEMPKIKYTSEGLWDPNKAYGDKAEEYFPEYIKEGYREEIILKEYSGYGFYKPYEDPISNVAETEDWYEAYDILTRLWEDYPECIDALVHLGSLYFEKKDSLNHCYNCYKVAVEIVKKSLPKDFDGIILWGFIENRPYLRALNGYCFTLWRQQQFEEALAVAEKLYRICPSDNLGIRFIIDKIRNHEEWSEELE